MAAVPPRKPNQPERRHDLSRVPHPIMVRYRFASSSTWHTGPVRDFSRTGARLISEAPVKIGDVMELWLGEPLFREPVAIIAKVIWLKEYSSRLQLTEVGLLFPNIDPMIKMAITEAVVRFIKAQGPAKPGAKPEDRPKS